MLFPIDYAVMDSRRIARSPDNKKQPTFLRRLQMKIWRRILYLGRMALLALGYIFTGLSLSTFVVFFDFSSFLGFGDYPSANAVFQRLI